MSVDRVRLHCDQCHRAWVTVAAQTISDAQVASAAEGWTFNRHHDDCPRCTRHKLTVAPAPAGAA